MSDFLKREKTKRKKLTEIRWVAYNEACYD